MKTHKKSNYTINSIYSP